MYDRYGNELTIERLLELAGIELGDALENFAENHLCAVSEEGQTAIGDVIADAGKEISAELKNLTAAVDRLTDQMLLIRQSA